jgi:hypothetical protein
MIVKLEEVFMAGAFIVWTHLLNMQKDFTTIRGEECLKILRAT